MNVFIENRGIDNPDKIKDILGKEGYKNVYTWSDHPGTSYNWHTHPGDEIRWVYSGSIVIGHDGGTVELFPGDKIDIKAGAKHWARTDKGVSYFCASK